MTSLVAAQRGCVNCIDQMVFLIVQLTVARRGGQMPDAQNCKGPSLPIPQSLPFPFMPLPNTSWQPFERSYEIRDGVAMPRSLL